MKLKFFLGLFVAIIFGLAFGQSIVSIGEEVKEVAYDKLSKNVPTLVSSLVSMFWFQGLVSRFGFKLWRFLVSFRVFLSGGFPRPYPPLPSAPRAAGALGFLDACSGPAAQLRSRIRMLFVYSGTISSALVSSPDCSACTLGSARGYSRSASLGMS
jgi:hypothetical protein